MRKQSQPFAPSKMIFAVLLVLSLALFQNCSNVEMPSAKAPAPLATAHP